MRAKDVLGPGSPLSRILPAYEDRPSQLEMAEAVERALSADQPLFVEAGTGTGKTLAYLVPAILSGRKVVVSTATRALQEQIVADDLPLVSRALEPFGVEVKVALMKGLPNYLCKRRHLELVATAGARIATDRDLSRIDAWARVTDSGDRAELSFLAEDAEAWREVQSSTDTRIGAKCDHYEECFVTRMRREAEEAQIVVVNHHLFFADLALRRGRGGDYASAIPNYDAVIFDEAHQIEDVATDFFGVRISTGRIDALVRDARRSLTSLGQLEGTGARPLLDLVEESAHALFGELARHAKAPRQVLTAEAWTADLLKLYGKLDACLEALAARMQQSARDESLAIVARRATDAREDLRAVVQGSRALRPREATEDDDAEPHAGPVPQGEHDGRVVWMDTPTGGRRGVSLGASPVDLGPTLREALFDRVPGVIMTSATLATAVAGAEPTFHFAKARLGAPHEATELVVPSPFDFASRAALYVTRSMPDPQDPAWDAALPSRAEELIGITEGGAFVLCTSNRAMRSVHTALKARLSLPVMVQGEAPKHLLLSKFRALGNAVLVATMSFWEGVDVPGRALRLVVLDKIPFAVPTDPVVMARAQRIEHQGGNSFTQYSVPSAAITLKQGFGRLIRTQTDAGIVAILDPRVLSRGYGRMLLHSLPPARQIRDLDQLREFWRALDEAPGSTRA